MKTDMTTTPVSAAVSLPQSDSTKLASLLALAAGAIAMPQSGHADIIFTDLSSNPQQVGFLGGSAPSYTLNLPGTVLFGFQRSQKTTVTTTPFTTTHVFRGVVAADMFGVATARVQSGAGGFAAPLAYGAPWNQGLPLVYTVTMGLANTSNRTPSSGYDHQYLAFRFRDSTQVSSPFRYGWVEVGLSIAFVNPVGGTSGGPNVTIYGYGWDNTGAQPTMGQKGAVPEPSSAALMIIGALALGAPGLRKWRHNRDAAGQS